MIKFTTTIRKFGQQGEKTGWTYILIPASTAERINPGVKKSYRVKGKLDETEIRGLALIPMGDGDFILALNGDLRKKIRKEKGGRLKVEISLDSKPLKLSPDLLSCLRDEPDARSYFQSLPGSHQLYYSKWIEAAKTSETRARRIAQAVTALARKMGYSEMMRAEKQKKQDLQG